VRITFEPSDKRTVGSLVKSANRIWDNRVEWKRRVEKCIVRELLGVKNDNWLQEGELPLTAEAFLSRMTLESIGFSKGGKIDFIYDDGDLFWGHAVVVDASVRHGPRDAYLFG
jgi:hypothetical protein